VYVIDLGENKNSTLKGLSELNKIRLSNKVSPILLATDMSNTELTMLYYKKFGVALGKCNAFIVERNGYRSINGWYLRRFFKIIWLVNS
jgi:hypothetical protein